MLPLLLACADDTVTGVDFGLVLSAIRTVSPEGDDVVVLSNVPQLCARELSAADAEDAVVDARSRSRCDEIEPTTQSLVRARRDLTPLGGHALYLEGLSPFATGEFALDSTHTALLRTVTATAADLEVDGTTGSCSVDPWTKKSGGTFDDTPLASGTITVTRAALDGDMDGSLTGALPDGTALSAAFTAVFCPIFLSSTPG